MTTIVSSDWTSAISGAYATAADWTPAGIPNYNGADEFDVFIGGSYTSGTSAFTVTSTTNEVVGFLDVGANATLAIAGGVFFVYSHLNTYSNVYNYGTISVAAGSILDFGKAGSASNYSSEIFNLGAVDIAGAMYLAAPYFQLLGSGVLDLSGKILGANTGGVAHLEIKTSTIQGSGAIGNGSGLALNVAGGVIDANAASAMTINTGTNTISNSGTIETTGAGGLLIYSSMQLARIIHGGLAGVA